MSIIYHKHHIVPRHMGGNDDPSNLIELTVEEHAEAHRKLFEQYGKEEDRIAWLSLSGQASKPEIMKMSAKLGKQKTDKILEERYGENWRRIHGKNASSIFQEKLQHDQMFRKQFLQKVEKNQILAVEAARSPESREKRKDTFCKNKHQQGSNNSNYGKMWIKNPVLMQNKTHLKDQPIPDGWVKGRDMNW
jgi:hypothetical protein